MISDYNNLVARNGAWIGNADGNWERLAYWQRESGQDFNSMAHEPLFADEPSGNFHLKSVMGRWTSGGYVIDGTHSPSIDAGDLTLPDFEPLPNGPRINQGAYGNTAEASLSRVEPWVEVRSVNDGGVIKGTNTLHWNSNITDPRYSHSHFLLGGRRWKLADLGHDCWYRTVLRLGHNLNPGQS